MNPLLLSEPWPSPLDAVLTTAFLATIFLLPAAGYVFMVLDVRAYLRSLRRGLVVIGHYLSYAEIPDWARHHTPRAVAALGLQMPCTEDDLKRAYRARVKQLHPDHGGDERQFLMLQANFEEALMLARATARNNTPCWSAGQHAA